MPKSWFQKLSAWHKKIVVIVALVGGISTTSIALYGGYSYLEHKTELENWVIAHKAESEKYPLPAIAKGIETHSIQLNKLNDTTTEILQRLSSIEGKLDLLIDEKRDTVAKK